MQNAKILLYLVVCCFVCSPLGCIGHCQKKSSADNSLSRCTYDTYESTSTNNDLEIDCIFCKIVKKEAPAEVFLENDSMTAFKDCNPNPPVHTLMIPKAHIVNLADVAAEDEDLLGRMLVEIITLGAAQCPNGFRVITNTGGEAHQTVFHLHFHILGGRDVGVFPGISPGGFALHAIYTDSDIVVSKVDNSIYLPHFIIKLATPIPNLISVHMKDAALWGKIFLKIAEYGKTNFNANFRVVINFGGDAHQEETSNLYIHIIGTAGTEIPLFAFS